MKPKAPVSEAELKLLGKAVCEWITSPEGQLALARCLAHCREVALEFNKASEVAPSAQAQTPSAQAQTPSAQLEPRAGSREPRATL